MIGTRLGDAIGSRIETQTDAIHSSGFGPHPQTLSPRAKGVGNQGFKSFSPRDFA